MNPSGVINLRKISDKATREVHMSWVRAYFQFIRIHVTTCNSKTQFSGAHVTLDLRSMFLVNS